MSVYVDDPIVYPSEPRGYVGRKRARARWGHMIADTAAELHTIARNIGLRSEWFQPGHGGHYDLVPSKRRLAIKRGAVALTRRAFIEKVRSIRARHA